MAGDTDIPALTNLIRIIHTLPVADVFLSLATRPEGLTAAQAAENLDRFGPNALQKIRGKPLYIKFFKNFTHLMAILLWTGGIVAFIAQMPQLGIAVWLVNVINGLFSFWQEYRAEKATEALLKFLPHHVRVIREGHEQQILSEGLVPGDVMLLSEGDHISADARLVQEADLKADQSTLTGESRPVHKTSEIILQPGLSRIELPNLVFAGTNVVSGTGKAVVFATGMESEFGKIAHLTQTLEEEQSPLQKELNHVTRVVTFIAIGIGLLFFVLMVTLTGVTLAESFIFGLGMIVAFVPEGLLPTVTLALARGSQRMAGRHALIKRLSAVETLGCTSVICTDKTGTLTQNEMTVKNLWVAHRSLTVTGVGYAPEGTIREYEQPVPPAIARDLQSLLIAAGLCNNARLLPPTDTSASWKIIGDPTEAALKVVALKAGIDPDAELSKTPRVRELAFDSRRKLMSTIHQSGLVRIAYLKGAPKEVLSLCRSFQTGETEQAMDDNLRTEIMGVNDEYARTGLRVLAVAMRTLPDTVISYSSDTVERDLTFLGLVAMMDPPRPEVAEAIGKCHHASIRVIMITGDYGLTAESIARRIGIVTVDHPRIVTGADLDLMEDRELREIFKDEVIFARVAPEHKLRVVSTLQEMGHVVAVTGDGVNDAPALKKADIGVAMGIAGTDVAKEAADMVLTDDNFASIVNAVEEGRAVYANIKKFTTYIFTSNTPEAVPFILFAFSRGQIPLALNVMQILSIDLGTDLVPALALGAERPEPGVMDKPPRDLKEHVITPALLTRAYLWLGPIQSIAAMSAFFFVYWTNGYWGEFLGLPASGTLYFSATAMALAAVVTTQIGNVLAQRTERRSIFEVGLFSNRFIWVGIATELVVICLIVYVPVFQEVFGTAAIPPVYWLFLLAWAPVLLIAEECRKGIVRWKESRTIKKMHVGDGV
ncbi:MAG: cation-transporting P-type ATPase [Methanoregula sp.]|nr:cation-transporting P-type ATPase [Methanoregula sp.]